MTQRLSGKPDNWIHGQLCMTKKVKAKGKQKVSKWKVISRKSAVFPTLVTVHLQWDTNFLE